MDATLDEVKMKCDYTWIQIISEKCWTKVFGLATALKTCIVYIDQRFGQYTYLSSLLRAHGL